MNFSKRKKAIAGNTISLLAGALLTLSFAPFNLFPLAILAPALLLSTWLNVSRQRAFFRGWLFGLGLFGTGVYWVFISIHTFGNASIFLAAFITVSLIFILALFPALNGFFLNRYFPKTTNTKILFAFPAIWILFEWMRSWMFTGFSWLSIGYSQIDSFLRGYAGIFSLHGVSLAIVMSGATLLLGYLKFRAKQYKSLFYCFILFTSIWLMGSALQTITWTKPYGDPIQVSLVQGNIAQDLKWTSEQVLPTLKLYENLSKPHWDSKIIIWPEGAIPISLQDADDFLKHMSEEARSHNATLITGIPIQVTGTESYYNSVIATGEGHGVYLKQRLVPFGEYTPFYNIFHRFLGSLDIPMSDFVPGKKEEEPLVAAGINIDTYICYEIAFPEQVRNIKSSPGIILAVSNDAWFGHSVAQAQHLEMARMRAIEMGRQVLFVSNNGITAIISANGKIQDAAPPYVEYVLTGKVQAREGRTPWQIAGMDPLLIILIIFLFVAAKRQRLYARQQS